MSKYFIFFILIMVLSCKHQHHNHNHHSQEAEESRSPLYNEVMTIHDAVMPEMSTIHNLKKELKAAELPGNKGIILNKIKALNEADEAMMSWMAEFKSPEDHSKAEEYLKAEKVKIQAVSDQMHSAIETATVLLDSLKNIK